MTGSENVRAALEMALNGMSSALATAYENDSFVPVNGTPYQICSILFAAPDNSQYGDRHQELGYMQVKLMYPLGVGTSVVNARVEMLRTTFARGNTFMSGSVTVVIQRTPEIMPGRAEDDRWAVPVIIRFFANI